MEERTVFVACFPGIIKQLLSGVVWLVRGGVGAGARGALQAERVLVQMGLFRH